MDCSSEDDFWNESSSRIFNFDDENEENESACIIHPHKITVSAIKAEKKDVLSVPALISNQSLNIILDEITSTYENAALPVEETIKKMLQGHKFVLEIYRTIEEKLRLLDCSLQTFDGNIIICVILFLRKTLKKNIFFNHLSSRKIALKYYADYLLEKNNFDDLWDLYMATGNISNTKELYYLINKNSTNQKTVLKKMEQLSLSQLPKLNSHEEKFQFYSNIDFLKYQVENEENCDSIIEQLSKICRLEWEKNPNRDEKITEFKKKFKIEDSQFEWTVMNVLAYLKLYNKLTQMFIKSNWLTKQSNLNSVLRPELFLMGLNKHDPPKEVLEKFLHCITDSEKSLELAQKLNCRKFVIEFFVGQKDRIALIDYKQKISSQSEEFFMIENALRSNDKKWKN